MHPESMSTSPIACAPQDVDARLRGRSCVPERTEWGIGSDRRESLPSAGERTNIMGTLRQLIWMLVLGFSAGLFAEEANSVLRMELTDGMKPESHPAGYWNPVRAFIELQTVQPNVGQGLEFLVEIDNTTSQALELDEPIRFMDVQLWNSAGVRVDIPDPDRGVKPGHTRQPEHLKAYWEERRPFHPLEPEWAQRPPYVKSVGDLKDGKVTLDPGEKFQATVKITNILAKPERWWAEVEKRSGKPPSGLPGPDPPAIAPILPDTYTTQVFLPLAVDGKLVHSKSHDKVTVRLGSR